MTARPSGLERDAADHGASVSGASASAKISELKNALGFKQCNEQAVMNAVCCGMNKDQSWRAELIRDGKLAPGGNIEGCTSSGT